MHNSKKVMCVALAAATVVPMMFAGCSKAASSSSGTGSSAAPKETVTLTMYTWGSNSASGVQRVTGAVNDYLKSKNTGLKIDWQQMDTKPLGDKIDPMMQTGQAVDIVFEPSWVGAGYKNNATAGYLTDLSPYLAKEKDLVAQIGSDFLDGSKINGKNYAMPTLKETAHAWGAIMKTDEMKKLGIDPSSIKTLADLEKYFDQAKKDGLTPMCGAQMDGPYHLLDWDNDSDGTVGALPGDNSSTTYVNQFVDSKTVDFYKSMKNYYSKGWISKDSATAQSEETQMGTGKFFCGIWSLKPGKDKEEALSVKFDCTQVMLTKPVSSNRETTGAMLAIPKTSTHKDEAFKFIKMLYTDKELINLMVFGQEGKDYTRSGETITPVKGSDYAGGISWTMGSQLNNYVSNTESPTKWKDFGDFNKSATALKSLGFMFDQTAVKNEIATTNATVQKEYPALFWGSVPNVDTAVATFKSDLEKGGSDKVIKELNDQYSKFLASKK